MARLTISLLACLIAVVQSYYRSEIEEKLLIDAVRRIASAPYPVGGLGRLHFKDLPQSEVVQTSSGPVQGFVSVTDRDGTPYSGYVGIPYATPPLGNLRFKGPLPVEPWTEVREVVEEGYPCPGNGRSSSEDCLVLNVFTPITSFSESRELKAVMVFIHGGGFMGGYSSIRGNSPHFYMDKDVLFVTLNYRLGPLGFLSLQNENAPGNAGLKDQVLALKWIKENIQKFGGDPSRIVVFGQSAGSASVAYLQLSSSASGLFHGAILESGTAIGPWNYLEPELIVKNAFRLGAVLGCNADINAVNGKDVLWECLMDADPLQMCDLQTLALPWVELQDLRLFSFLPTTEPELDGAFLTESPHSLLLSGEFNHVPMIIGVNSREGLMVLPAFETFDPLGWLQYLATLDKTRFVPYELHVESDSVYAPEINNRIRNFYFNGSDVTLEQRLPLMDLVTDSHFNIYIQLSTNVLADHSNASIWNYRFTYEGPFNMKVNGVNANVPGVDHSDELGYLMNPSSLQGQYAKYPDRNSRPQLMIDQMSEMWTNFAKYGSPTPTLDGYVKINWKPFTSQEHNYLNIGETLELKLGLVSERMKFWNDIFELTSNTRPLPE